MKVTYPVPNCVSVWVGTLASEDEFDECVDRLVAPALSLDTHISSICEVSFELKPVAVQALLDGFSGCSGFLGDAVFAAAQRGISTANSALVCYYLQCLDAPQAWEKLHFLGSFNGNDRS